MENENETAAQVETIEQVETAPAPETIAQVETAQETVNPYDTIITQKDRQIDALIAQNESLTAQITKLIQSGAQINTAQPLQQTQQPSLQDDWSLESIAREIGRGDHGRNR